MKNKKIDSRDDQYNLVQIGGIKVCSTNKSLREVASIASDLVAKEQRRIIAEQETLLEYIQ